MHDQSDVTRLSHAAVKSNGSRTISGQVENEPEVTARSTVQALGSAAAAAEPASRTQVSTAV